MEDNKKTGPASPAIDDSNDTSDAWYKKGRQYKKAGDYSNAIVCFQSMLQKSANDTVALNEFYKCCILEGRLKEGIDAVNKLVRLYVNASKKTEALTVYGELMQSQAKHCFEQDVQIILSEWLEEFEDFEGAVTALMNYADRYKHDKRAPDLLLRAALICQNRLDDKEQTQQIADLISERYPDSKAAEEAALLFFDTHV